MMSYKVNFKFRCYSKIIDAPQPYFFNADDKACNTLFPDFFISSFESFYFVIVVNLLLGKEAVDVNILSYRACILSGFPNVLL